MTDMIPGSSRGIMRQQPDHRLPVVDSHLFVEQLLVQRLALRLQHFGRLETQRQVVAALSQERVHLPPQDGFALFGEPLQSSAGKLGFERLTETLKTRFRRIREDLGRFREVPGKLFAHIPGDFLEFRFAEQVGFGEQYGHLRRVVVETLQQIDVALRKGRVRADRRQRQSNVRQPRQ